MVTIDREMTDDEAGRLRGFYMKLPIDLLKVRLAQLTREKEHHEFQFSIATEVLAEREPKG